MDQLEDLSEEEIRREILALAQNNPSNPLFRRAVETLFVGSGAVPGDDSDERKEAIGDLLSLEDTLAADPRAILRLPDPEHAPAPVSNSLPTAATDSHKADLGRLEEELLTERQLRLTADSRLEDSAKAERQLQARLDSLERDLEATRGSLARTAGELADCQSELAQIQQNLAAAVANCALLEAKKSSLEARVKELVQAADSTRGEYQRSADQLRQEIRAAQEGLAAAQQQTERLKAEMEQQRLGAERALVAAQAQRGQEAAAREQEQRSREAALENNRVRQQEELERLRNALEDERLARKRAELHSDAELLARDAEVERLQGAQLEMLQQQVQTELQLKRAGRQIEALEAALVAEQQQPRYQQLADVDGADDQVLLPAAKPRPSSLPPPGSTLHSRTLPALLVLLFLFSLVVATMDALHSQGLMPAPLRRQLSLRARFDPTY